MIAESKVQQTLELGNGLHAAYKLAIEQRMITEFESEFYGTCLRLRAAGAI